MIRMTTMIMMMMMMMMMIMIMFLLLFLFQLNSKVPSLANKLISTQRGHHHSKGKNDETSVAPNPQPAPQ